MSNPIERSGLDVDALSWAFLGGLDDGLELPIGEVGEAFRALGIALGGGEHLVAFDDVGEAVVEQGEDVGCDLFAKTVAGAEILVDPDLHVGVAPWWVPDDVPGGVYPGARVQT